MDWNEQNVRVVCSKTYTDEPPVIIRGVVRDADAVGMKIEGRIFQKILHESGRSLVERPVDDVNKVLFIPYVSMKFCEQIVPETRAEEIDKRVQQEGLIPTHERRPVGI